METNKSKGGRPRDSFASYIVADKDGKPVKTCKFCGHLFNINTSITRVKAHLGKVKDQGVALCTGEVPSNVEKAARMAITSLSNKRSNPKIPSNSDMKPPPPQECYTLAPPQQTMQLAEEECPRLLDVSQRQSNFDPMDVQSSFLLQDNIQQLLPQGCSASCPPHSQNMQLDVLVQRSDGVQLDTSGLGTSVLGDQSPVEVPNLFEDDSQFLSIFDDPEPVMNQMALNTPQPNESYLMQLVSPHPVQEHQREQYAPWMGSMYDISMPQDMMTEPWCEVPEMQRYTLQHNGSCSTHSTSSSQCPRQQHPREDHNHLLDQELLPSEARMDSMHDTTTPQNLLEGEACLNSLPDFAHQEYMPITKFDYNEGLRSWNHMQENLQGDHRIISLDHDQYTFIVRPQHHVHSDPLLQSLEIPTSTPDQDNKGKKRKSFIRAIGKPQALGTIFQGQTFKKKVDEICESLEDNSVSRIGVYGMGGSGKTTIMKFIHNLLLKERFMLCSHVIWVTVSQDHTIPKLQHHLASLLNIQLSRDEDEDSWAASLYEKMRKVHYALILDDVWDVVNLEKVGIPKPSRDNGCKLILTTRSLDVCRRMQCRPISIDLLLEEEAWKFFVETLNVDIEKTTMQVVMKEVSRKCARLPLAIVTVAGSMRGILDAHEWRYALDSLRSRTYGFTNMEKEVIEVLKFSYYRLSEKLQQCLLSCALFPEDRSFCKEELIEMLMTEGHIRSDKSLKSAYDEGHTVVNKLENACLLTKLSYPYDRFIIHDLIRDMCLDIMGGRFLVKCGSIFPPEEFEFTKVLEKVSLMNSKFEEIPVMVPNCPELSSLLLLENRQLTRISDSFFTNFLKLKVLNLSSTSIQVLPSSVTNLVSLNALVLRECYKLRHLPCLAPLKALKQLDLYKSEIEEAPEGLEELVNLTYLDLDCMYIKPVSSSILTNLVKLQYLKLPYSTQVKDVKELKKLEVLKAGFANWEEFSEYVNGRGGHSEYDIIANLTYPGTSCASMIYNLTCRDRKEGWATAWLLLREDHNIIGENHLSSEVIGRIPSPRIVRRLWLEKLRSEPHQGETKENGELKGIVGAMVLFPFSNLVDLYVHDLDSTKHLISASSSIVESGSSLKVLPCFQSLQELSIKYCKSLESILISTTNPTEEDERNNPISFPNLRKLDLYNLPNLRSICDSTLICPSIEYICIIACPKLKRLPLQLPLVLNNNNDGGKLSPPLSSLKEIRGTSEWWEALEWDQPHAKAFLQPYFQ